MNSALIVSCTDKGTAFFSELLREARVGQIAVAASCAEARRTLLARDFDLVLINAPLKDETGERFARDTAAKGASQVMLVVKAEYYDAIQSVCEDDGALVIAKPVNRDFFRAAVGLLRGTRRMLEKAHTENEKLKQKIEDIRIIDRAKCVLISYMHMDEKDAHRYIEKQAMDMRSSKRAVAEGILKTYEN